MTTFIFRVGAFKFGVMPFRLINTPYFFARMIDSVLREILFAHSYLDNAIVFF